MRSIVTFLGSALVVAMGLALAAPPSAAQQKTELRVAYIPVVTWLPLLVANDTKKNDGDAPHAA